MEEKEFYVHNFDVYLEISHLKSCSCSQLRIVCNGDPICEVAISLERDKNQNRIEKDAIVMP